MLSKKHMNMAYGLGASVVILGALFKITHFEIAGIINGSQLLTIGLVTEAIIFGISAFEKPEEEYDWSLVYPQLKNGSATGVTPDSPEGMLSKRIDALLNEAKVDAQLMKRLADSIENFEALAKQIQPSVEALSQTERYAKQLAETTDQLQSLRHIYASQVESNSKRADAERDIADQTAVLKAQLVPLIENIRNLNEVYSSMLTAMKK
jgi:gliding motility-associated protein GldL